ncbi:MAG: flippase-like domain-containing protein [Planctomycetes bacterium]|nr:flippase-like domain-containing protein [Planctomycetota bacterium]
MKRALLALLATAVLVAVLLALLDLDLGELATRVGDRLAVLSPTLVALAFLLYIGVYVGRALRFAVLLPGMRASLPHLVSISARHNLLNLVLPLRSGEISLPWMLRTEAGRSLAEGAAALVVARVLDLGSVATFMLIGLATAHTDTGPHRVGVQAAAILGALLVGLLLVRPLAALALRWLGGEHALSHAAAVGGLRGRVSAFLAQAAGHLVALSRGRLLVAGLLSLLAWAFTYASLFAILRAAGGDDPVGRALAAIDVPTHLVGATGLHLTSILPVNTLGGVGAWEAGWTAGYVFAGVDAEAAGVSGVVSHVLVFGFILVLGGLGFLLRPRTPAATSVG